ncbi:MAG: uroporphyrinogen-III synthase [Glaciecola sp.]|jgi:uroporphyrinogen-III synthase
MYLILRPKSKLANSVKCFNDAGIEALGCALIDTPVLPLAETILDDLQQCSPDIIIVTSTVAADIYASTLNKKAGISSSSPLIFIGVGVTTTKKLRALGLQVIQADPPNSEGIVAVVQQLKLDKANVAILKGKGGRKLISESLSMLGFIVTEFNVYERIVLKEPFYTKGVYAEGLDTKSFMAQNIQCIIATSTEIIDAAYNVFEANWLNSRHWLVVSKRTKQHLTALGANNIIVSNGATDSHLIAAVNQVKGSQHE